jgi:hypothetical protein
MSALPADHVYGRLLSTAALHAAGAGPPPEAMVRRADGRAEPLLALGIRDRRFGWPLEMVLRAAAAGWRVEEAPVTYLAREGRSKVTGTLRGTVRAVRDMAAVLG